MWKPEEVKGFSKLMAANQKLFRDFLKNFYNAWEDPDRYEPISVSFKKDKANGAYLKFEYKVDGRRAWLHVKGPRTWY